MSDSTLCLLCSQPGDGALLELRPGDAELLGLAAKPTTRALVATCVCGRCAEHPAAYFRIRAALLRAAQHGARFVPDDAKRRDGGA